MKRTTFKRLSLCSASALMLLSMVSFAGDNSASTVPAYPAGSCTYFIVWTPTPTSGLESELLAGNERNVRRVQATLEWLEQQKEEDAPADRRAFIQQFTVTVWSDGAIDATPLQTTTELTLQRLADQLDEIKETKPRTRPVQIATALASQSRPTPQSQSPGMYPEKCQCHARKANGERCTRSAKGTTGFCWQHQDKSDEFPDK